MDPDTAEVVGFGGFTGPPEDGVVEIGYSIAPLRRGRGHATAAARCWVDRARAVGVDGAQMGPGAEPPVGQGAVGSPV